MQFVDLFSFTSSVEIKRELRYCAGFKCKSIYFLPQVEIRWQHEMSNQKFVFIIQGSSLWGKYNSWTVCPVSGCCIYGVLDQQGTFSGNNIAWVYPDYKNALIGDKITISCLKVVSQQVYQLNRAVEQTLHLTLNGLQSGTISEI